MKLYKKQKLIETKLFHRNLQFHRFIKTSPSVLPGCNHAGRGPNSYAPQPTS